MGEKNILYGPKLPFLYADKSVGEIFFDALKCAPSKNKKILIDAITNASFTAEECFHQTLITANKLHELGIHKGDTIGIVLGTRVEFAFVAIACFYLGAAIHPTNPEYNAREITNAFAISKPKLIITTQDKVEKVLETKKALPDVEIVVTLEEFNMQKKYTLDELNQIEQKLPLSCGSLMNDAIAMILCSSGTTGYPKGIIFTDFILRNLFGVYSIKECGFGIVFDETLLIMLPFYHIFGVLTLLLSVFVSARAIVLPKFNPETYLKTIQTFKISGLFIVPPLAHFLAKSPLTERYDLSSLRNVACGGAPLGAETQSALGEKLSLPIKQIYGMTESATISLTPSNETRFLGSSGQPFANTQIKIVNIDTQQTLGVNEVGEICVKVPTLMKCYFGNVTATKDAFDSEGYLHTGDLGYYNEEGFIFIVDRLKELIKYKGFQIAPAELEDILMNHPLITDAAVVGIQDERAGEVPKAYIVRSPNSDLSENDVITFVDQYVSFQKRLHGGVQFIEAIPKTASGKILRQELRKV